MAFYLQYLEGWETMPAGILGASRLGWMFSQPSSHSCYLHVEFICTHIFLT